jgi:hypothetical protein
MAEKKCSTCHYENPIAVYMKGNKELKMCPHCREISKKSGSKRTGNRSVKCPHGKRRNECVECNGSTICDHKIKRHYCILCGGASLCQHNRAKHACGACKGGRCYNKE